MRALVVLCLPACLSLPPRPLDTGDAAVDAPHDTGPPPNLFGNDMVFPVPTSLVSGETFAASFLAGTGGTVRSVVVYIGTAPPGARLVAGIYDDNGGATGVPGGKLKEGEVSISAPGWYQVPVAQTPAPGGTYWLAALCPGCEIATMEPVQATGVTCAESADSCVAEAVGPSALPTPWPNSQDYIANSFSIYASEQQ